MRQGQLPPQARQRLRRDDTPNKPAFGERPGWYLPAMAAKLSMTIHPDFLHEGRHQSRPWRPFAEEHLPPPSTKLGGGNCRVGPGNFTPSPSQIRT
jgi:hypothetical protein